MYKVNITMISIVYSTFKFPQLSYEEARQELLLFDSLPIEYFVLAHKLLLA